MPLLLAPVKAQLLCYEANATKNSINFPLFQQSINDTITIPLNDINRGLLHIDLIDKLLIAIGKMQNDLMAVDRCEIQIKQMYKNFLVHKPPSFLATELDSVINSISTEQRKNLEAIRNFFCNRRVVENDLDDVDRLSEVLNN
jgi:hypothetical protein